MKTLTRPDEKVIRAFLRLKGNQDFEIIKEYLLDESLPSIDRRLHVGEGVKLFRDQGAALVIEDLRDIILSGEKWLNDILMNKKREGTGHV